MKQNPSIRSTHNEGFTIVVIAALFIAFAVIAAVKVERNAVTQMITRRDQTVEQLRKLSYAIMEYGALNATGTTMLYPCPATDNVLTSDVTFGVAVTACSSTTGDTATATSTGIPIMGPGVIRGMVPVQALALYGINMNDAIDPWNNRIEYVVNRNLTLGSTSSSGAQSSNPTITEPTTLHTMAAPDFILISYGRDALGAHRRDSTGVAITCPTSSTVLRQRNCSVTTNYYYAPTYTASSATSATYFDDLMSFYRQ